MLYDLQTVVRDKNNVPGLQTDLVTSSKRRIYDRIVELKKRKQQARVWDQTGVLLSAEEIDEMRRS
jgi:hypothetical protein